MKPWSPPQKMPKNCLTGNFRRCFEVTKTEPAKSLIKPQTPQTPPSHPVRLPQGVAEDLEGHRIEPETNEPPNDGVVSRWSETNMFFFLLFLFKKKKKHIFFPLPFSYSLLVFLFLSFCFENVSYLVEVTFFVFRLIVDHQKISPSVSRPSGKNWLSLP